MHTKRTTIATLRALAPRVCIWYTLLAPTAARRHAGKSGGDRVTAIGAAIGETECGTSNDPIAPHTSVSRAMPIGIRSIVAAFKCAPRPRTPAQTAYMPIRCSAYVRFLFSQFIRECASHKGDHDGYGISVAFQCAIPARAALFGIYRAHG